MNILILSPHTDDAELGAGGTITKYLSEGHKIKWVVFSTAEESLPIDLPSDTLSNEFTNVYKSIGLNDDDVKIFHFKVRHLNYHRQEVLEELYKIKNSFNPDLVIGPSMNDLHQDHKTVAEEMIRAFKSSSSIISYELPWNHLTFNTQMFIKLDEAQIGKKLEMLNHYKSQIKLGRYYFSEDFIRGLAITRGAQINHKFAEAFEVIRWIG